MSPREIEREYAYVDEHDTLLFQCVRYRPKGFSQRRPDGSGGWINNLEGVRRVVYRLPELLGQKAILYCEGEKDTDRAWSLGIPATCNAMGAGKFDPSYAEQLKAQGVLRVAVVPDNDAPGAAHAKTVALGLRAAGLEVRLVSLPDVPDHGDLSDYLERHSRDELLALIRSAPKLTEDTFRVTAASVPDRVFVELADGRYVLAVRSAGLVLEVGHLYRHRDGTLNGELTARVNGHFQHAKTYGDGILSLGDFNFSSVSMRSTRAKLFAERAGDKDFDWFGTLEEFAIAVVTNHERGDPPEVLADELEFEDDAHGETWDVDGLPILVNDPMVLFGDSASGKSYLALWIAGTLADRGVKILYVDWEFSQREHRKRLSRLFQPMPKNIHYIRSDAPIVREIQRLKRLIAEHKYEYLICDSIGFAVDGPAETHEAAKGYFGALRMCGIGSLSLAHIAKAQGDGRDATIFGSTFFRAGARSAWFVERASENQPGELHIGLHHRKANSSELQKPLAYKFLFRGQRVFVERDDITKVESLTSGLPILQRIKKELADGAMTIKELTESLMSTAAIVRATLSRHKSQFVKVGNKFGLKAEQNDPESTPPNPNTLEF